MDYSFLRGSRPADSLPRVFLSPEQARNVRKRLTKNHYQPFNSWLQVARCQYKFAFTEPEQKHPFFKCILNLRFERYCLLFMNHGEGRNKKEAKRKAIENTINALICQGCIAPGFRDLTTLDQKDSDPELSDEEPASLSSEELQRLAALHKQLRRAVAESPKAALPVLREIAAMKDLDWLDIQECWEELVLAGNLHWTQQLLRLLSPHH
jgi:hypothetical protein